jgi:hypothetical protein
MLALAVLFAAVAAGSAKAAAPHVTCLDPGAFKPMACPSS